MKKALPGARHVPAASTSVSLFLLCIGRMEGLLQDFCRIELGSREKASGGRGGEGKGTGSPRKAEKPKVPYLCGLYHSALLSLPQEPVQPMPHPEWTEAPSMI